MYTTHILRHDQVLLYLLKTLAAPGLEGLTFYSDLEGWKVGGGSIPPDIIVTAQRPDLVILDKRRTPTEIHLVELTIPFDTIEGIERAKERKSERYAALATDIREQGLKCHLHTLEIGTRGYISPRNRGTITHLCKIAGERKVKEVLGNCSKQALLGSKVIYNARGRGDSDKISSQFIHFYFTTNKDLDLSPAGCRDGNSSTDLGGFLP